MLTNNRSMKRAIAALCVATLACSAVGCGEEKKEAIPTFSNATYIAQMATLKCYYHNTAKLSHEGSWFFNNGYKRMWMEYSGIVKYGIDADKVTISPDANGHKVIITVPPAHVLDDPDVNEKSFSKPLVSTGFATSITAEEKTEMFDKAQQSMLKQAKTDSALLAQAEARARTISRAVCAQCAWRRREELDYRIQGCAIVAKRKPTHITRNCHRGWLWPAGRCAHPSRIRRRPAAGRRCGCDRPRKTAPNRNSSPPRCGRLRLSVAWCRRRS